MIMMEKTIDYRFKILYAVAMIMVVCGHASGGGIQFLLSDWFPYSGIHLAIFVFCSGYFYSSKSEEHIFSYIWKKVKSLLIPLYVYNLVYGIIVQLLRYIGFEIGGNFDFVNLIIAPIVNGHQFVYNMGGWFVIPLFMLEVYNVCFRWIIKRCKISVPEIAFFVTNVMIGLVGNILACNGVLSNFYLVLVRALYFAPFYGMGIYYKRILEKYERKIPSFWYFCAIFTIKLIIVCVYGKMPAYTPSWCNDFTEGPIMPIIIGYLGIALWMRIATILEPVIGKSKGINLIADNTYSIMMNQFMGFMIVKTLYAVICKTGIAFADFDWYKYKTEIWWYYMPKGLVYTLIIYVVFSIVFSIVIQKIIDFVVRRVKEIKTSNSF